MSHLLHLLHYLSRFLTTRMVQQSGRYEFIFAYLRTIRDPIFGGLPVMPRSSLDVPSLRWRRNAKRFSTYFISQATRRLLASTFPALYLRSTDLTRINQCLDAAV